MERKPLLTDDHTSTRSQSAPPDRFSGRYRHAYYNSPDSRHPSRPLQQSGVQATRVESGEQKDEDPYFPPSTDTSALTQSLSELPKPPTTTRISSPYPSYPETGSHGPTPGVLKDQKRRMAIVTLVALFVSCAGKVHGPVITQYTYQIYTDMVYGNASHGVKVSKEPCVNSSTVNQSSTHDPLRDEVQAKSADMLKMLDLMSGGIGIVANLLIGSYSDVLGRRFMLLVPITGHFLRNVMAPIVIYWDLGLPALYLGYILDGLCGGSIGISMGYYAYTADITKGDSQRTLGMAIIGAVTTFSTAGLDIAVGIFIEDTGFLYPSLMACALLLVSIFIVITFLPETVSRDRKRSALSPVESVKRMFGLFSLRDHPYQRLFIFLGLFSYFMLYFPSEGLGTVSSLYLMGEPFCMDALTSGIQNAVSSVVKEIAGLTVIKFLQTRVLTPGLVVIGSLSSISADVVMALAINDLMIYLSSVAGLLTSVTTPALRSMTSRMVPANRQGTLFAWIAMVESVCKSFAKMAFTPIYKAVLSARPGFIYFILVGTHVLVIGLQIVFIHLLRRVQRAKVNSVSIQTDSTGDP